MIEFYHLEEAHPSITRMIANQRTGNGKRSHTINTFRDYMIEAGWQQNGANFARVTLWVNIDSLPVRTPDPAGGDDDKADGAIICTQAPAIQVIDPDGVVTKIWGYDPGAYREPPCDTFSFGFSHFETYLNFKAALTGATGMGPEMEIPHGDGAMELRLKAEFGGPDYNGMRISGWTAGEVWYGGWHLASQAYRGWMIELSTAEGPGWADGQWSAWEFSIHLQKSLLDFVGTEKHEFSLGLKIGGQKQGYTPPPPYSSISEVPLGTPDPNPNTPLSDWSWYRLCACPYQFAIFFNGGSDAPYQPGAAPRSMWVSMPWVPEGFTGHKPFVFVSNTILENFRNQMGWPALTQFDERPWQETGIEITCMRARSDGTVNSVDRVSNTQGAVLIENAYVCTEKNRSGYIGNHRVAGKLWNCATLDQTYSPAVDIAKFQDGGIWVHASSHAWAADYSTLPPRGIYYGAEAASVWWRVDNVEIPD